MAARTGKRPWGRIVTSVLAAGLLTVAIPFFFTSAAIRRCADTALTAMPAQMTVDVSKATIYEGEFDHTYPEAVNIWLQVTTSPVFESTEAASEAFDGFAGRFSIIDADGAIVDEAKFDRNNYQVMQLYGVIGPAARLRRFPARIYEARFTVDSVAPRLAGISQTLVARYNLYGLEYVAADVAWLLGFAGCVIAGILILFVVAITISKRRDDGAQSLPKEPET